MARPTTPPASHAQWSSRIDPLIARYRRLVPLIGREDAVMAMSAVARMILAVEKAESVGSRTAVSMAEDSILQAGKLLEAVGPKSHRDET
jgi:hypothetical protein